MADTENNVKKNYGLKFKTWRDEDFKPHPHDLSEEKVKELLDAKTLSPEKQAEYEAAFAANPKDFARLYSITENTKRSKNIDDVSFTVKKTESGEDRVWAIIKKMQPSGITMAVSNGAIKVMPEGQALSPDRIKELAHFCWMNGISAEFPSNVDESFRVQYEKAEADLEHGTSLSRNDPNDETSQQIDQELEADSEARRDILKRSEQLPEAEREKFIKDELEKLEQNKNIEYEKKLEQNPDIKKIDKSLRSFMDRIGKEDGKTFFRSHSWKGDVVYRLYAKPGDRLDDGKINKGKKSNTYEIEIRARVDKDGNFKFTYGTPDNKPIAQPYTDELVSIMKSQGFTHIEFPSPILDADKGAWREACARNGVIPEGFNLNEHHVKKMMGIAETSLSKRDFLVYKKRMADRLEKQLARNNIKMDSEDNRLRETIENLRAEYDFTPFKNAFEASGGIQSEIDKIVRGDENGKSDVVEVVGAALGFAELYQAYKVHRDKPISSVLNDPTYFNATEKAEFLSKTGIQEDSNILLRDIGSKNMTTMHKVLSEEWQEKTQKRFSDKVSDENRVENIGEIIKGEVNAAYARMKDVAYDLDQQGAGKIYPKSLGNPVYTPLAGEKIVSNKSNGNNKFQKNQTTR